MTMFYIVAGTLAIFCIASVLFQVKSLQGKFNKIDKLGILPNYSFFAPKPLTKDYRVVYKIIADGEEEWIEMPMYKPFNILRLFWNPFKYYNKAMIDTCHFLLSEFEALENKVFIQVSLHYINILLVIDKCMKRTDRNNTTIRFAIVSTEGIVEQTHDIVFASYHQVI